MDRDIVSFHGSVRCIMYAMIHKTKINIRHSFEKIRKLEMDFLIDNWNIVRASGQVEEYLEVMSQGKIPHARSIFGELFKRLKPEPSNPTEDGTVPPDCY
jgi:hypothetical protein